jgi:hypothetical protein
MTERRPIGLTVPYREVGYKEKSTKREWVGLTNGESLKLYESKLERVGLIEAVEDLLRKKNT